MSEVSTTVGAVRDAIRRHPWWTDSLLALFLTVIAVGSTVVARTRYGFAFPVLAAIVVLFTTVPIALRRYRPIAVLAITVTAETLLLIFSRESQVPLGVIVALYTVAAQCERRVSIRAAEWVALPITVGVIVNNGPHAGRVIPELAVFAIAWVIGDNMRTRRAYLAELEARAARLEREREEKADRAVIEERTRIARELHDVIAHNVSVMVVQAAAGEEVFEDDPVKARESLSAVASTGRAALAELRRLLGVIRTEDAPDGEPPYAPQPGIEYLDELVRQVRETGLRVELSVLGEPRRAAGGSRVVRVPDRPGGAHKHAQARRRIERAGQRALRCRRARAPGARRRARRVRGQRRGRRPRADRHARAGRAVRRRADGLAPRRRRLRGPRPAAAGGTRAVSIRVLICDDQALVRAGFRAILGGKPEIEVVGEAENGAEAVALAERRRPDVILMDIRMPVLDGVQATRRLVADGSPARILVLTTFDLDEYVHAAIRAGASGFLLKDVTPAKLLEAIRIVAAGDALLAPSVTRRLLERFATTLPVGDRSDDALAQLTARETEVLRLLAGGLSNAEIAAELVVTEATVKTHISSLLRKLGLRDRVQAVILAYETGLVQLGSG